MSHLAAWYQRANKPYWTPYLVRGRRCYPTQFKRRSWCPVSLLKHSDTGAVHLRRPGELVSARRCLQSRAGRAAAPPPMCRPLARTCSTHSQQGSRVRWQPGVPRTRGGRCGISNGCAVAGMAAAADAAAVPGPLTGPERSQHAAAAGAVTGAQFRVYK